MHERSVSQTDELIFHGRGNLLTNGQFHRKNMFGCKPQAINSKVTAVPINSFLSFSAVKPLAVGSVRRYLIVCLCLWLVLIVMGIAVVFRDPDHLAHPPQKNRLFLLVPKQLFIIIVAAVPWLDKSVILLTMTGNYFKAVLNKQHNLESECKQEENVKFPTGSIVKSREYIISVF